MQSDNIELRDRIEILQSIIRANASDYENYDWRKIIEEENELNLDSIKNTSNKSIENVVAQIVDNRKENRMLKRRIEHLELQISHLTNHFDFQGNLEPTRAAMLNSNNYNEGDVEDSMPEHATMMYYENSPAYANNDVEYFNNGTAYNMKSNGFSKGPRGKVASKSSIRDSDIKRSKRPDVRISNGKKKTNKSTNSYGNASLQYQHSFPAQIPLTKTNGGEKDKDEALKMLYDMMMNRVNKKRKNY